MGALLSPQEPARTSGRTGLKGDHGEKVREGGKGCPSLAALIPAHSAPLPFLPPVPGLCRGPIRAPDRVCPHCIWELAAARAAGTPAEVAALLPQAGIEASLNSPPLLERSQPWPRASLFPPSVSGALPELGSVSSTPSVLSLRGRVPPPWVCCIPVVGSCQGSPGYRPGPAVGFGVHKPAWLFFLPSAPCHLPTG